MDTVEVIPSGTVGKVVFPVASAHVRIRSISLRAGSTPASVRVQDGLTSAKATIGNVSCPVSAFNQMRFSGKGRLMNNGTHVLVLGTNAKAYIEFH